MMQARHHRLFERLDRRHDPLRAAVLGMFLGIAICGVVWSMARANYTTVTAMTESGMMVGYGGRASLCREAAAAIADGGSADINTPWGETFAIVRVTCDGSDPRKLP